MLAERDDREAARRLVRRPLGDGGGERPAQRPVGEVGKRLHQPLERDRSGQIADRKRQRERAPLAPQGGGEIRGLCPPHAAAAIAPRPRPASPQATG